MPSHTAKSSNSKPIDDTSNQEKFDFDNKFVLFHKFDDIFIFLWNKLCF